jgi:hypothetical protein
VAKEHNIWWPDFVPKVRSAWDVWIYLAGEKRRQQRSEVAPTEEVDDQIRTQQAESLALLRRAPA